MKELLETKSPKTYMEYMNFDSHLITWRKLQLPSSYLLCKSTHMYHAPSTHFSLLASTGLYDSSDCEDPRTVVPLIYNSIFRMIKLSMNHKVDGCLM